MRGGIALLAVALSVTAAAAQQPRGQEASRRQTDAGSILVLEEAGERVVIRLAEIKGTAASLGLAPGLVYFNGRREGQGFTGTAIAFFANCRPGYAMTIAPGPGSDQLTASGEVPDAVDPACRVTRTVPRSFVWRRVAAAAPAAMPAAPDDPRIAALRFDCTSNPGIFGNPLAPPPIAIRAQGRIERWEDFADAEETQRFLGKLLTYARAFCAAERAAKSVRGQVYDIVQVSLASPRGAVLEARYGDGQWRITNSAPGWLEQDRRQAEAKSQHEAKLAEEARIAAAAAAERRRNRQEFAAKHAITQFVGVGALVTNPFPFKDRVVGVHAAFSRMISEQEAMFGDLLVTGLPPTEFTASGEPTILAVRIGGLRPVRLPGGVEMPLPYGAYLGAFRCREPSCSEFFDPR